MPFEPTHLNEMIDAVLNSMEEEDRMRMAETIVQSNIQESKEDNRMEQKEVNQVEQKKVCAWCGKTIEDGEGVKIYGKYYCDDCVVTCADCGKPEVKYHALSYRGKYYCRNCFVTCAECNSAIPVSEALYYEGGYYCHDCTTTCDVCGRPIPWSWVCRCVDDDDTNYCQRCIEDTYVCERCGDHYASLDNLTWDAENDKYYCSGCYRYVTSQRGPIRTYHTMKNNERPRFYGNSKRAESLHMGFELEVDAGSGSRVDMSRNQLAQGVKDMFGDFFRFENDGSLSCRGWENISQPADLQYLLDHRKDFETMFEYLMSHGMRSHDVGTCGLHIHLDRNYFGPYDDAAVAKMLYLFEKFRDNMLRFSRRNYDQCRDWAKFRKDEMETLDGWIKYSINRSKNGWHDDRYYAVNLINNNTVEIRLWRGTLNINTFFATLKFTARLAELCKKVKVIPLMKMTWEDLLGSDPEILAYWDTVKDREIN